MVCTERARKRCIRHHPPRTWPYTSLPFGYTWVLSFMAKRESPRKIELNSVHCSDNLLDQQRKSQGLPTDSGYLEVQTVQHSKLRSDPGDDPLALVPLIYGTHCEHLWVRGVRNFIELLDTWCPRIGMCLKTPHIWFQRCQKKQNVSPCE